MAFPFLSLPNELRLFIYRMLFFVFPVHMYTGFLLSCQEIFTQAGDVLPKVTRQILKDIQDRWNARLRWPLEIKMPVNIAQLRRITLLMNFSTMYGIDLEPEDLNPYLRVIRRIVMLGSLRPGFPAPSSLPSSSDRLVYTVEGNNGGIGQELECLYTRHADGFLAVLKKIRGRPTRHDWSVTVSTDQQNGGYRVHFGIQ